MSVSSEEESSDEVVPAKKPKTVKVSTKPASSNKNNAVANVVKTTKTNATPKIARKTIPLSKLGIVNNVNDRKRKIEIESSSDSSSSSSCDERLSKEANKKKPTKNVPLSKKKINGVETKKKNNSVDSSSDDSSSSSSSSSSSDSDSSDVVVATKNKESKLYASNDKSKSKVDFHVSGLSVNATSTPGVKSVTNADKNNNSKSNVMKTSVSANEQNMSQGKKLALQDKYKNISQVYTYSPQPSNLSVGNEKNCSTEVKSSSNGAECAVSKGECKQTIGTTTITTSSLNNNNMSRNSFTDNSDRLVSGKTLRNRKRRQRKIELAKLKKKEEDETAENTKPETIDLSLSKLVDQRNQVNII